MSDDSKHSCMQQASVSREGGAASKRGKRKTVTYPAGVAGVLGFKFC